MSDIRKKTIEGLQVGENFSISRTFTEENMIQFSDISRDYNPVHFDERFAKVKKFSGRICHGLLVGSMITEIGGQIGWLASEMNFRFKKPVYPGDTITCSLTIAHIDAGGQGEGRAIFQNQDGIIVLEAIVTGVLPGSEERGVMKAMVAEGDPTNKLG